ELRRLDEAQEPADLHRPPRPEAQRHEAAEQAADAAGGENHGPGAWAPELVLRDHRPGDHVRREGHHAEQREADDARPQPAARPHLAVALAQLAEEAAALAAG